MSSSEYEKQDKYQKPVDYEQNLLQQMGRIAQYRSNNEFVKYIQGITALIIMLPKDLRTKSFDYKKELGLTYAVTADGIDKYDELWIFINELLEEANLIYRMSYIKTFS